MNRTSLPWVHARTHIALFSFVLSLWMAPAALAQTQLNTYTGFDGQQVSGVDIAAAPSVNLSEIRPLIQLQPGQPFSSAAMRQSLAALQALHRFTQIQTDLEPDQTGLHVTFILEPADYVGLISFIGTGTNIPYTSLLQAVNIPEQSPYVPGLENRSVPALASFLRDHGFFSTEITTQIERDEAHRIVNITYICHLGKAAKIHQIDFSGLAPAQSGSTRAKLRSWWSRLKGVSLRPGQRYSAQRVTKAIPLIRSHLRQNDELDPSVQPLPPAYDIDTNRVDLTFQVSPGPKVSVQVVGAKLSAKNLRKLVPIYEERSVDQDLVDEGEANIRSYFQTKGYFDVTASSHLERQDGMITVTYTVTPGAKHRLADIDYDGNHFFSDRVLSQHVTMKQGFLFVTRGKFSEQLVRDNVNSLTQLYKDNGFESISIQPRIQDLNSKVRVTFLINEGPQDHVASLRLAGNKTQTLASLSRKFPLKLKLGSVYSPKLLDSDRTQLTAAYLDRGYQNVLIRSAASPASGQPHKFDVTFNITEGPEVNVSSVVLLGNRHTKSRFIQTISSGLIKPGKPLSEGNLLQAETDLYGLSVFDWTSIRPLRPIVDQTNEEVLLKVHESPFNSVDITGGIEVIPRDGNIPVNSVAVPGLPPVSLGNNYTVSQKSYVGPRFAFAFTRNDLRGHAETATLGTIVSRLDQRAYFTYANPHLHGSSWSSLLNISAERTTENPIYTAELGQASIQVEKALDAKRTKNAIVRYTFQRTDLYDLLIPDLVLPKDQHVRLSTFEGEYIRDSRDKPLDAHHGVYQTFDLGVTSTALGASANFLRFLGQSAFYIPLQPWLTFANNFRLGFALPFSGSYVPLSESFFSGGADSLRGFPIDGAGPQRPVPACSQTNPSNCTLISVPVGGEMLFIVNSEARFPLPIHSGLGGVVFYDGGNVYSNINLRQFANDFTHTIGFGLRYQTPVGPVRVDIGYRLTPVPGVQAIQYFVTLGQSF